MASRSDVFPSRMLLRFSAALLISGALLAHGLFKELDHDEHQFIASAALLARYGLLPYRDYPYFHVPYLILVYAALFLVTDHLLLGARLVSITCSIAITLLLASMISEFLKDQPDRFRRLAMTASILLLLTSDAWLTTSGRAWNHDLPTLLVLVAYLLATKNSQRTATSGQLASVGALVGCATGTRLTFAPVAIAFVLAIVTCPSIVAPQRRRMTVFFLLGFVLSLFPCAIMFALAPKAFIFGNFKYPLLNMAFRSSERYTHGLSPAGKFDFIIREVLARPANLILFLFFCGSLVVLRRKHWREFDKRFDLRLLMLLLLSLFIGALAPTPLFSQYFFTPAVFMVLTSAAAISRGAFTETARERWTKVLVLLVLLAIPSAVVAYRGSLRLPEWNLWTPMQVHALGQEVAKLADHGRVLTLAPTFPLEGHCEIYPELATGPFEWRVAPFVNESMESDIKMFDPDDLEMMLAKREPNLVLLGREKDLDLPLVGYAKEHHIPMVTIAKPERGVLAIDRTTDARD